MEVNDINKLLDKYYNGDTTLAEERVLQRYFTSGHVAPELAEHIPLFAFNTSMQAMTSPVLPDSLFINDAAEDTLPAATLVAEKGGLARRKNAGQVPGNAPVSSAFWQIWAGRVAAGLALLLIGFASGIGYHKASSGGDAGNHQVVQNNAASNYSLLSVSMVNATAGERLQAIQEASMQQEWDEAVVYKLIAIMNFDENVNVRLAASEALMHFGDEPTVRQAMINSLSIQADPAMQIALIDMLVALKERGAVQTLQQITLSDETMDVVKQRAAQGMGKLM